MTGKTFFSPMILLALSCGIYFSDFHCVYGFAGKKENMTDEEKFVGLKSETIDRMLVYEKWVVAAVRCDHVRYELQGTRSERVFIEATVLAAGGGKMDSSILLTRFTQGSPLLHPGHTYLIGAYDDRGLPPAYTLIEWIPIDPKDAEKITSEAFEIVLNRKKSKK